MYPIWSGFAVNTLFYAAVLWLLTCGRAGLCHSIRRFLWRRRGFCPVCGYPMAGSAVCPECGSPLPEHS